MFVNSDLLFLCKREVYIYIYIYICFFGRIYGYVV